MVWYKYVIKIGLPCGPYWSSSIFSQVYGQSRNQLNFVNIQKQRKNKRLVMSLNLRWLGSINPPTSKKMGSLYENSCAVHFSNEPHS